MSHEQEFAGPDVAASIIQKYKMVHGLDYFPALYCKDEGGFTLRDMSNMLMSVPDGNEADFMKMFLYDGSGCSYGYRLCNLIKDGFTSKRLSDLIIRYPGNKAELVKVLAENSQGLMALSKAGFDYGMLYTVLAQQNDNMVNAIELVAHDATWYSELSSAGFSQINICCEIIRIDSTRSVDIIQKLVVGGGVQVLVRLVEDGVFNAHQLAGILSGDSADEVASLLDVFIKHQDKLVALTSVHREVVPIICAQDADMISQIVESADKLLELGGRLGVDINTLFKVFTPVFGMLYMSKISQVVDMALRHLEEMHELFAAKALADSKGLDSISFFYHMADLFEEEYLWDADQNQWVEIGGAASSTDS